MRVKFQKLVPLHPETPVGLDSSHSCSLIRRQLVPALVITIAPGAVPDVVVAPRIPQLHKRTILPIGTLYVADLRGGNETQNSLRRIDGMVVPVDI